MHTIACLPLQSEPMAPAPQGGNEHQHQHQPVFRVVDTALVAPHAPPPPPCSLPLTFFDVKWLHLPPVENVFFYRLAPDADAAATLAALRLSLSHALRAFYPLAGHVRRAPGHRHELHYQPGDAVPFTVAEYAADVDDLASDHPVKVSAIAPLVPQLPKGRRVLAAQATLLLGGGSRGRGLAVGVAIHHSACDGNSAAHFLRTWAAACAGREPPPAPVIDRAGLIPDPRGLYDVYLKSLPPAVSRFDDDFEFATTMPAADAGDDKQKVLATFTLTPELLQSIKGAVASEAARRGVASPRCSSLVATASFIWCCYCRCRARAAAEGERRCYFLFSVDHRARLKPAVPEAYLGNCLCPAIAAAAEEEVAAGGAGGLFAACAAVAAALEEEVGEGAAERWTGCVERVKEAVAKGTLSVAGSTRLRMYDVDFGFGRPAKLDIVSVAKTGAISVAESPKSGNGVEVGISLPADAMGRFQDSFADGVASLLRRDPRPLDR
ncbi:hypothetical protein ACP4OV_001608 [Aristida adscensionis]